MSKTALSLLMLQILKSRSLVKKSELAELLETNPRNIIELKRELETAGYQIDTISGPNGGYVLNEKSLLSVPDLTIDEITALQEVLAYLKSSDVTLRKDTETALEKILSVSLISEEKEDIVSSGIRLSISSKELQKNYDLLKNAIQNCHRVRIAYRPKNKDVKEWIIHPYGMFLYRGMWYLVAYRENDHEITLKLNRIVHLEETNVLFFKSSDFDISRYAGDYGISIGKNNHLVARIRNRYYLSEYIYGENQKITPIDDDTILLEVDLPNEMNMKSFVLELGSDCKVLEPKWLMDYLKTEAERISEIYKQ